MTGSSHSTQATVGVVFSLGYRATRAVNPRSQVEDGVVGG